MLKQIPLKLRSVALIVFLIIALGLWTLTIQLKFPEKNQVETYLYYIGKQKKDYFFTWEGPDEVRNLLNQKRQSTFQLVRKNGATLTITGLAIFKAPDSLQLTADSHSYSALDNCQEALYATIEVTTDTVPLWKKIWKSSR